MSETIQKLQRALSQAQTFLHDAPLEALARAQLVAREAEAALGDVPTADRAQIEELLAMAVSRVRKYEQQVARWDKGVRLRAELFHTHEVERLQRPIASKI